jgi:hypothetical protein
MRRSLVVVLATASALILFAAPAAADEPEVMGAPVPAPVTSPPPATSPAPYVLQPAEPARTQKRWYGWQTLTADGVSLSLVYAIASANAKSDNASLLLLPLGTYLLVPPIIHLAHERYGAAAGSFGLRLGLPLGGALLGGVLASSGNKSNGGYGALAGAALGMVIGVGGAIAIDAAVLSREEVKPDASSRLASEVRTAQTQRAAPPPYRVKVMPVLGPRLEGGIDVGLGAIF